MWTRALSLCLIKRESVCVAPFQQVAGSPCLPPPIQNSSHRNSETVNIRTLFFHTICNNISHTHGGETLYCNSCVCAILLLLLLPFYHYVIPFFSFLLFYSAHNKNHFTMSTMFIMCVILLFTIIIYSSLC